MTTAFLVMFLVGCALTLVSVLLGAVDASGLGHIGHGHVGHAGHVGHMGHAGHIGHAGDVGHAGHAGHVDASGHGDSGAASTVSPLNYQSLVAFLIGFGGVGYLVMRSAWGFLLLALVLAVAGGIGTGWLILKWMRFLVASERPLPPTSWIGLVGHLSAGIREGGTGELTYSQNGIRMMAPARSSDGRAVAQGEQVVVLRYENGFAYVEPWHEFMEQKRDS